VIITITGGEVFDLLGVCNRLLITGIAGISIYLGYRLFSLIPLSHDSRGEFNIPNLGKISLTRVGPGVFFALFGSSVLIYSLASPVSHQTQVTTSPDGKKDI
jgi:hypothetical protein